MELGSIKLDPALRDSETILSQSPEVVKFSMNGIFYYCDELPHAPEIAPPQAVLPMSLVGY